MQYHLIQDFEVKKKRYDIPGKTMFLLEGRKYVHYDYRNVTIRQASVKPLFILKCVWLLFDTI